MACSVAQAAPLPCKPQDKLDVSAIKAPIVIVGEIHGTQEVPAFVSGLACSYLRAGRPVVLGIEQLTTIQPALDRYMASDGSAEERKLLAASAIGSLRDGRGSMAMLEMIESARQLAKAGAPLNVHAFDPDADFEVWRVDPARAELQRDSGMAANILAKQNANPGAVSVNLMGNSHSSRKLGGAYVAANFEPAAYQVAKQAATFEVKIAQQGGQSWYCSGKRGKPVCEAQDLATLPLEEQDKGSADVIVALGATKASPPMRD